ncbi:hypothetical protein ACU4IU_16955 [Brevibacterium sp. CSND-B09]|uniref:hypothetical protein n=1 Tax=Brevibacterium sp. CSND-B09 TaxID=3462571 RepID=UPI00406A7B9D
MTGSSYVPIGQAVLTGRMRLNLNQSELADRLNDRQAGHWNQGKVSRIESSNRELSLQELLQLINELGVDAFRNTYELDQIFEIAGEHTQSLKSAMLDAIDGLEAVHTALTRGLS